MLDGLTVSLELSLLESPIVTPPGRAPLVRNTGSVADSPGATFTPAPIEIFELAPPVTVTPAIAPVTFATLAEAVIVAEPELAPLTGTTTDVAFAVKDTEAGTAATDGLLELNETVRPAAGAGHERLNSRF
jgi:hypothetical protein